MSLPKTVTKKCIELALRCLPDALLLPLLRRIPRLANCMPPGRRYQLSNFLGNLRVAVDTTFPIERQMLSGRYDPESCEVIARFVPEGSVCVDVGANVGALTLAMAQRAGSRGKVFAFEPGPATFEKLKQNVALNERFQETIQPVNFGVSDKAGDLFWNEDPDNLGNAWLSMPGGTRVEVTTIDEFFQRERVTRIGFVKIDVEGMEYEVLCGGVESWKRFRPILYFETMRDHERQRGLPLFANIEDLLKGLGYTLFKVEDGRNVPVTAKTFATNTLALP